jgi:ribosomal 50S subunit-associated protein YjgA (DUF615 family)
VNEQQRDELLVRVDERIEAIHARLEDGDKRMNMYSGRIRSLEAWRNRIVGGLTVVSVALGLLWRKIT